ncbi:hypothetical protein GCM10023149_48940 [Mucilaginibacter gynuensis]|uniref:Uncharacterized protein n=1 Tax=Mucilaginibacter gynuensis TaxID=1302236 RepID=A0ABP8HFN9_9SPHI
MDNSTNAVVMPVRKTWRDLIDEVKINGSFLFPKDKFNSVSNIVSTKFHATTVKRFSVTYKDAPLGQAKLTRLSDATEE